MCSSFIKNPGKAINRISGETNRDAEATQKQVQQRTANVAAGKAAVRKKTTGSRRKANIQKFSSNVASGGQKRVANVGK